MGVGPGKCNAQTPSEIIPPCVADEIKFHAPPIIEAPPDGLHPNQYATRLLEEIHFPVVAQNIRAVAAAIECEAKAMGVVAAYEFVLECTKFAMFEEYEINTFFFTDGKYRPERRNSCRAVLKSRNGRGLLSRVSGQLVQKRLY